MEKFGLASWPGITDFDSCTYTLSQGVSVGYARLIVSNEQARNAKTYGDLVLSDGVNQPFILRDCKIGDTDSITMSGGANGTVLHILDKRWKWAFGWIDGFYNKRNDQGAIEEWTRKSFKEMINACVEKMIGEGKLPRIEIGDLKDPDVPFVDWSSVNPSRALANLVEPFGGIVCWRPYAKEKGDLEIVIAQKGKGASLPNAIYKDYTNGKNLPENPDAYSVVTAPVVYQVALPLEAVGLEPGGDVKLIDDLSYKPAAGWGVGTPPHFRSLTIPNALPGAALGIPGLIKAPLDRNGYEALAKSCVYRTYRIVNKGIDGGKLTVPGYGEIKDLTQLVPVNGLVSKDVKENGEPITDPVKVFGIFDRGYTKATTYTTPVQYEGTVNIDPEKHLVTFDQYLYKTNVSGSAISGSIFGGSLAYPSLAVGGKSPAELVLLCSVMVRDEQTHQIYRDAATEHIGDTTEALIVIKDDVRPVFTAEYDPNERFQLVGQSSNKDETDRQLDFYLEAIQKQFETSETEEATFAGIIPLDLDGSLAQVTYTVGGGNPCQTRVSRNTEHAYWLPNYAKRRGNEDRKLFFDVARGKNTPLNPILGGSNNK